MQYICDVCGWEYFAIHAYPGSGNAPFPRQENSTEDYDFPVYLTDKDRFSKE